MNIAERVKNQIDAYCQAAYHSGHRNHLGASLIGDECSRKLWYVFRWCFAEKHSGRMLRLFNRGHLEEARFIEWLQGAEITLISTQSRISAVDGHFGGSMDGVATASFHDKPFLLEFKTSGTGYTFENLMKNGVKVAKPQHYAQICTYGLDRFTHCLYLSINKNTDDLYIEWVELDPTVGLELQHKANDIIYSPAPPVRISKNPTFYKCRMCEANALCHQGEPAVVNCRSCRFAKPVEKAQWHCARWNAVIDSEFIKTGCSQWESIL